MIEDFSAVLASALEQLPWAHDLLGGSVMIFGLLVAVMALCTLITLYFVLRGIGRREVVRTVSAERERLTSDDLRTLRQGR